MKYYIRTMHNGKRAGYVGTYGFCSKRAQAHVYGPRAAASLAMELNAANGWVESEYFEIVKVGGLK